LLAIVILPLLGWSPPFSPPSLLVRYLCVGAGSILLLLGVFSAATLGPMQWLVRRLPFHEKLEKAVGVLALVPPLRSTLFLLLSAGALGTSLLQFVLLLHAMGADVPVLAGMLAAVLTFFLKGALPISIGSLGIGEWTAMYCFKGLGVDSSVAVAASLLLFTINVFVPSLIGLPFISSLRVPRFTKAGITVQ
jgi:uncharacterized membrane protein YbhN (UPF0104 family)